MSHAWTYAPFATAPNGSVVLIGPPHRDVARHGSRSQALKAVNLLRNDRNAVYLAPYNFAFGFAAAMLVQYANKAIITDLLQPPDSKNSYVGFASSIAVGCGAVR